ncbi:MAG: hypothetical protein IKS48_11520 [Eubacterium sp.]|nr:hypothetical protein [Clostridiales bacterium]MBR6404003.1 hypothetical protein [Eubacterium sp.]
MKTNRIALISILSMFTLCSCTTNRISVESHPDEASYGISVSENAESLLTTIDTQDTQIPDYSIGFLNVSLSFDELLDAYMELYGINSDEMASVLSNYSTYVSSDSRFFYAADYQSFLEDATRPVTARIDDEEPQSDPIVMYYPMEYEYHITRKLYIEGIDFVEFEGDNWAEECFRCEVEATMNSNTFLSSSSTENGYCFALDDSRPNDVSFYAYYYVENYTINYSFNLNSDDVNGYSNYLERCDELGLPTCDQITEMILD